MELSSEKKTQQKTPSKPETQSGDEGPQNNEMITILHDCRFRVLAVQGLGPKPPMKGYLLPRDDGS